MGLFGKPSDPAGITFMVRGEPGSGKTWFGLGLKKVTGLPVAYIGLDRGAKFYKDHPEIGGFLAVEARDADTIEKAIEELKADNGKSFGAVVLDTVTDLWNAEQKKAEKVGKDGNAGIPMRAWRPLRESHEQKLRDLQSLPMHVVLVCEEKPIYQKLGVGDEAQLVEVGSKEDADKKDAYVCDVRLRFYLDRGTRLAEVLKDRTGTFPLGRVIENPTPEMWVHGRAKAPAPVQMPPAEANAAVAGAAVEGAAVEEAAKKAADGLMARIKTIKNVHEMNAWGKKHGREIKALPEPWQTEVTNFGAARRKELEEQAASAAASAGGAS